MSSTNVNAERFNYLFLLTEVLTIWGFSENSPGAYMYLICEALRIYIPWRVALIGTSGGSFILVESDGT
jgi:hypothetical protein